MGQKRDRALKRTPSAYWSMHPQTRLGYEILPYLRELDDHEWTTEERESLWLGGACPGAAADGAGEAPLVAQARMVGDL